MYYDILHQELNYLKDDDIELVILYLLNALTESASEAEEIGRYNRLKLFSTFGTYLNTESIKVEFLKLICSLVRNYKNDNYENFNAYDQLINSVTSDKKDKITDFVKNNVSSYYYEKFYEKYDSGDYLPF